MRTETRCCATNQNKDGLTMNNIPRNEYPRPQLVRDNWLCLNGEWDFEIDNTLIGKELERLRSQTHALLDSGRLCGFCYTQLTDVEEELNGLYTYDRKPKFDPAVIREIVQKKAKIEQ